MIATETRPVDPGDPYVDPPRNWKRVGLIAAAWAALWVVVGALGWVVMQVPVVASEERPEGANDNPGVTVYSFLSQTYVEENADVARQYVCESSRASLDPATFVSELKTLEAQSGKSVQVAWEDLTESGPGTVTVRISYKLVIPSEIWTISLVDDGGWCISGIVQNPAPAAS